MLLECFTDQCNLLHPSSPNVMVAAESFIGISTQIYHSVYPHIPEHQVIVQINCWRSNTFYIYLLMKYEYEYFVLLYFTLLTHLQCAYSHRPVILAYFAQLQTGLDVLVLNLLSYRDFLLVDLTTQKHWIVVGLCFWLSFLNSWYERIMNGDVIVP